MHLAVNDKLVPCLYTLAVTCLLMAAKIAQPVSPSFTRMICILGAQGITVEKKKIIDLEEKILKALDFSLRIVTPIDFLDRFSRLLGIDQEARGSTTC